MERFSGCTCVNGVLWKRLIASLCFVSLLFSVLCTNVTDRPQREIHSVREMEGKSRSQGFKALDVLVVETTVVFFIPAVDLVCSSR